MLPASEYFFKTTNVALSITNVQSNLARRHIAILPPLMAANALICHFVTPHGSKWIHLPRMEAGKQGTTHSCIGMLKWAGKCPLLKVPLPAGGSGPSSNTLFLATTTSQLQDRTSIGSSVLTQFTCVTNTHRHRQTDTQTTLLHARDAA